MFSLNITINNLHYYSNFLSINTALSVGKYVSDDTI